MGQASRSFGIEVRICSCEWDQRRASTSIIRNNQARCGKAPELFLPFLTHTEACYSESMQINVELPEDIARHQDPGREALEALAIQGYRSRQLTQFDVGRLLGLSRIQTEDFLAGHVDLYDYSTEELESEADLLHRLHR